MLSSSRTILNGLESKKKFLTDPEINRHEIAAEKLEDKNKILGKGCFASVHEASYEGEPVAIKKFFSYHSEKHAEYFKREVLSLIKVDTHCAPNIVKFFGFNIDNGFQLVFECLHGKDLDYLLSNTPAPGQNTKSNIIIGAAQALEYLHGNNLIHRDLKPANFMVSGSTVKMIDFGFATEIGETFKNQEGTPLWMAPEVLKHNQYSFKSDVWAMGFIIWATQSWVDAHFKDIYTYTELNNQVVNLGRREAIPECPDGIKKSIESAWQHEPEKRPTATQLLTFLKPERERVASSYFSELPFSMKGSDEAEVTQATALSTVIRP